MIKRSSGQSMLRDERRLLFRRHLFMLMLLWSLVLVSALAVIYMVHDTRAKFNELEELRSDREVLQVQWGQYVLEEGTWASFERVEVFAVDKLQMQVPVMGQTVMVSIDD